MRYWPFARRSWPYLLMGALPMCIGFLIHWIMGLVLALPAILVFQFFRDPDRMPPEVSPECILAPADGKVISIDDSPHPDFPGYQRISIFMNVFNVHVNRAPINSRLKSLEHHPGKFLPADNTRAPVENERMDLAMETEYKPVLIVLVAGLIARRIVSYIEPDDTLIRGGRMSMIKFGSRVDVHVPADGRFLVSPGTKVKAGLTPVYEFSETSKEQI